MCDAFSETRALDAVQDTLVRYRVAGHTRRVSEAVLEALRALPVEERAAAVGLVRESSFCEIHGHADLLAHWCPCPNVTTLWVEAESPPQRSEEQG